VQEIHVGNWEGQYYRDVQARHGPIVDLDWRLFIQQPPGGETYADIAVRMADWLAEIQAETRPIIAISHGMSGRVLRGLLAGGPTYQGTAIAPDAPQGSVFRVHGGSEALIHVGSGSHHEKTVRV
jgi:probable phosphoglycerate mutase